MKNSLKIDWRDGIFDETREVVKVGGLGVGFQLSICFNTSEVVKTPRVPWKVVLMPDVFRCQL